MNFFLTTYRPRNFKMHGTIEGSPRYGAFSPMTQYNDRHEINHVVLLSIESSQIAVLYLHK